MPSNRRTFVQVTRELVYYMDRLLVSTVDDFNDLHNWIGTDWHRIDIRLASDLRWIGIRLALD